MMKEIFVDRKNKGNVTYRVTLSDDAGRVYLFVQKLMKKGSKEPGKKVTKDIVKEFSFYTDEVTLFKDKMNDEIMYLFCIEAIGKAKND
jgi:hypothetical protein